ncbi:MAG: hypothetical protein ED556_05950 [Winogradskyella sp.]|uniref:hypothetical protein n=1 Tax=Winogradskyella sp. TaxID=1883156 RepID=UPI000F3B2C8D|nr:hypothetical protein [Winogradskyella sp.]RNC86964.1 MAG: hypothetical protein ED556_05950 [Winogradskyella sp.]
MKKLVTLTLIMVGLLSFAQPGGKRMQQRIKTQKIAFITEKLGLTTQEAQQFWPIYNEFEATTERIKTQELRSIRQQFRKNPDMSDSEANKLLDRLVNADTAMHNAKMKLINDLKSVIPAVKIIKLKAAEDEFNKQLLQKLREFRERRNKN